MFLQKVKCVLKEWKDDPNLIRVEFRYGEEGEDEDFQNEFEVRASPEFDDYFKLGKEYKLTIEIIAAEETEG